MTKRPALFVVVAVAFAVAASVHPTQAAQYTITAGVSEGASTLRTAFVNKDCDPAIANSPLNGKDALLVPIGSRAAGSTVTVKWLSGTVAPAGKIVFAIVNADCSVTINQGFVAAVGNEVRITLRGGHRWLLAEPSLAANITLNVV